MDAIIALLESRNVWVLIPLMGMAIPITAVVFESFRKISQTKHQEQSRREVAAYVAEGSITPEEAALILSAKPGSDPMKHRRCKPKHDD